MEIGGFLWGNTKLGWQRMTFANLIWMIVQVGKK
jgi:hypothetical protein